MLPVENKEGVERISKYREEVARGIGLIYVLGFGQFRYSHGSLFLHKFLLLPAVEGQQHRECCCRPFLILSDL